MSVTPKVARQTFDAQPAKLAHAQPVCLGLDKGAYWRKQHAEAKGGESPACRHEDHGRNEHDPAPAPGLAWRGLMFCRGQKL